MRKLHRRTSVVTAVLLALSAVVASGGARTVQSVAAAEPTDMVLDWNLIALGAIGNAQIMTPLVAGQVPGLGQPPPLAPIHLAMVHGAIYDAVNAIDGGHAPYRTLTGLPAARADASQAAAAATAAYHVLSAIGAQSLAAGQSGITAAGAANVEISIHASYLASLAEVDAGQAKTDGIAIGEAAATAMLDDRLDDGRFGSHAFAESTDPGRWQIVAPGSNNVFGWVARVDPFTMTDTDQFRTSGPLSLDSARYAVEFNEVKALGAKTGSSRTQEQSDLANFVSANPVPMLNRLFREAAIAKGLSTSDQARLFVTTTMSSADALIGCWDDKDHWNFWRPQTAIQLADQDGNDATVKDGGWTSLVVTPGYPDHPSGYNCFTGATMNSAKLFFGTNSHTFTLNSPGTPALGLGIPPGRNYTQFTAVVDDAIDGRIYAGLHFRTPDVQGAKLGRQVAQWVDAQFFAPVD